MPDQSERTTTRTGRVAGESPNDRDRVFAWRYTILCRAGYREEDAATLALAPGVDLHAAVDLLEAGCPPATAAQILI